MDKRVCVLLNNSIANDNRVIKTIQTLSQKAKIDLFYIDGDVNKDLAIFNENVSLFCLPKNDSFKQKLIRHSFFTRDFLGFVPLVLSQKKKYDFVWANDLPTLLPASRIAKKLNARLIYDSHEIYVETLNQFFPVNTSFFKRIVFKSLISFMKIHGKRLEGRIVKKTDYFITVNDSILAYFQSIYSIDKSIAIMNLPYKNITQPIPVNFIEKFDLDQRDIICLYQGVLNEGRGLTLMIDAIKLCASNVKLIVLGSGTLENKLKHQAGTHLDSQIFFIPRVPLLELPNYTAGADFGINFLENFNLSKKMASPNKLFEYIHAGIPVLCSKGIENDKVLDKFEIGQSVGLEVQLVAGAISEMCKQYNSDNRFNQLVEAKEFYSWENQEGKLIAILA